MGRTIDPMAQMQKRRAARKPLLRPSVSMSLRLVIPWQVALQQSSPPLHRPVTILGENKKFEKRKSFNSKCANKKLSQLRGSPHLSVEICVHRWLILIPATANEWKVCDFGFMFLTTRDYFDRRGRTQIIVL